MTVGNEGPPGLDASGPFPQAPHAREASEKASQSPGQPTAPEQVGTVPPSDEPPVLHLHAPDKTAQQGADAPAPLPDAPPEEASAHEAEREATIRAALNRVLTSSDLRGSPRLATFLRFVVEATLAGRAEQIKGYTIAVEALGRPPSFDPQADPIVRVEATRLRRALQSYYSHEGQDDPLRIQIPKGGYVPVFEMRPLPAPAPQPPSRPPGHGVADGETAAADSVVALSQATSSSPSPTPVGQQPASAATLALNSAPATRQMSGTGEEALSTPTALEQATPATAAATSQAQTRPHAGALSLPTTAAMPPPRRAGWRMALAGIAAVALLGALALPFLLSPSRSMGTAEADKVKLPLVEVGLLAGEGPPGLDLRRLEERLRDAFAQFDFVEVRSGADTDDTWVRDECRAPGQRSVFTLDGTAVPRADGSAALLLLHLRDRCAGVIVWSQTLNGLGGEAGPHSEMQMVSTVAIALMESYGVIPVRARSQALAHAPESGFGCIAEAFAVLRGDGSSAADIPRTCLAELTTRDRAFALGHAVRAAALLDAAVRSPAPVSDEDAALMLREAELAADLAPSSAFAARTLALTQIFLGETQVAIESAERALRLNPLDLDVAATAGQIFIAAGQVEKGEALLTSARAQGAARAPLQETYLALAAFLRSDPLAAQALVPQLSLHPSPQNRIALALALQMLGRAQDAHALVRSLTAEVYTPDAVRRLVQHLLPDGEICNKVLAALETAGLTPTVEDVALPRG